MAFNLIALLKDNSLKLIVSTGALQNEITEYFIKLYDSDFKDKTKIDFDGDYSADEDEVFAIREYSIAESITNTVKNPLSVDVLDLSEDKENIRAILCGSWDGNDKRIMAQAFDARHVLAKKFTLINAKGTYTKLDDPGIILDERIDAVFIGQELLFQSYHNARKIVDLSEYYKEATNEDLVQFTKSKLLLFDNTNWFVENADSTIRKKVALLQRNKVLASVSVEDIVKASKGFEIEINVKKRHIVMPNDKTIVKEIIKFLDEDYFVTPLTKRKCVTNSKRYL
ncbi:MAG: Kiwa anti-phage protein KwaB-like domain-containing protein [Polyangia bacterium]